MRLASLVIGLLLTLAPHASAVTGSVCSPLGSSCALDSDCCDGLCQAGLCSSPSAFVPFGEDQGRLECSSGGSPCGSDSECCSGYCGLIQVCE